MRILVSDLRILGESLDEIERLYTLGFDYSTQNPLVRGINSTQIGGDIIVTIWLHDNNKAVDRSIINIASGRDGQPPISTDSLDPINKGGYFLEVCRVWPKMTTGTKEEECLGRIFIFDNPASTSRLYLNVMTSKFSEYKNGKT